MRASVFDNLFVLEMANNHWGDVSRGPENYRGLRESGALQ